ncbi:uncharacterized protein LOC119081421 isoform X2 [Bradysia coprophila]|uniref:uncharacterized protein LOC119081421 isoform X2 n=1 Tax=Bradysia coprophila TaxID=38358 RepID=UPI00187DB92D|nr:uncharacterized protein LOC119081421 isoform X2 [Bradysia coprophila]
MMIYFCNYFVLFVNIVLPSLVIANFYNRASFPKSFVGSNLFGDGHFVKKCFSIEDVALLSARSKFEAFVPNFTSISQTDLENDRSVEQMLEYLEEVGRLVNSTDTVGNVQYITQAAYYDVIGGYLHFYYLPFVKFSFYAGTLTYRNTLKVYNFQNNCKQILNTHGNGWRMSTFKFLKMQYKIPPINIRSKGMESETNGVFKDPCGNLLLASDDDYTSDYSDRELIVSLPRIEPVDNDSIINVWLPFKHRRNFILNSKSSAFVLTRYYVDVLKCYQFRNMMSNPFSRRFKKLLHEKVLPLIQNDEFYPGFGAILRVLETLKGSSLNPRGIHQYDIDSDEFWDDTASLVDEADPNLIVSGINEAKKAETVNETNVFLKVVDSIRGYEMQWNEKQKTKYICLAIVVMIIGLLMILLCIFISRELRKTNVNTSTLTRERKNNWKTLLRKLSQKSGKNELDSKLNSESDLRYPPKHEDTTSDSAPVKPTTSLINPTEYRHTSSGIKG